MRPAISLLKSLEDFRKVDPNSSFIIRLDGRNFSKLTKTYKKPFDLRIKEAMKNTTKDAVKEFGAVTGFTASDEITLIFSGNGDLPYNGRIEKITTLISAYVSVRFNFHLETSEAIFDARLVVLSPESILIHQIWRSVYDTFRNTITLYCLKYYNQQQIHGKSNKERINLLLDVGVDFSQIPPDELWGTYFKRELVLKNEGEKNQCQRTIITGQSFKITNEPKFIKLLLAKYWD